MDSHTLDLTCLTSSLYLRFHTQLLGFSAGSLTKTDTQFSQRAALTVKQSLWGESHWFSVTETHKQHHLNALMTDGHSWVPEGWCAESYTPVRTHTQRVHRNGCVIVLNHLVPSLLWYLIYHFLLLLQTVSRGGIFCLLKTSETPNIW